VSIGIALTSMRGRWFKCICGGKSSSECRENAVVSVKINKEEEENGSYLCEKSKLQIYISGS
jgi:hypothetical protein